MGEPPKSLVMLDKALSMEREGKAFYQRAIEACHNDVGREIFKTLKSDEDIHIARIRKITESLGGGNPWSDEWKNYSFSHGDLTAFFSGLAQKHGSEKTADANDVDALNVGIDFELRSVTFYEGSLVGATDSLEREFISQMVIEEKSHHKILEDAKLYLTDPSSWFREHEKGGLDGA